MKKDVSIFIEHILECISLIERYTQNKTEDDFLNSVQLQDSVLRTATVAFDEGRFNLKGLTALAAFGMLFEPRLGHAVFGPAAGAFKHSLTLVRM